MRALVISLLAACASHRASPPIASSASDVPPPKEVWSARAGDESEWIEVTASERDACDHAVELLADTAVRCTQRALPPRFPSARVVLVIPVPLDDEIVSVTQLRGFPDLAACDKERQQQEAREAALVQSPRNAVIEDLRRQVQMRRFSEQAVCSHPDEAYECDSARRRRQKALDDLARELAREPAPSPPPLHCEGT